MRNHQGEIIDKNGQHKIMDCQVCGFAHLYPLPSGKALREFYREEFYQKRNPDYITKIKRELWYWNITYQDRLEIFKKYVKGKNRRVLDIGCSGGYFLRYFQERGWETLGIELSPDAASASKKQGIPVITGPFEDIRLEELGKFDCINMTFLLEHALDPIGVCKKCYLLLKEYGILAIEVPNDFNPLQLAVKKELKKPSYWISYPDHINYFTHQSLERMLKNIGFKPILKESSFPMELFLFMGKDYIGNNKVGLLCHRRRMRFEKNLSEAGFNGLKRMFYQALGEAGMGRETIQYFLKTNPF